MLTDLHITRVESADALTAFSAKAAAAGKAAVVLATSKKESSSLYKALSMQLHRGLAFGEVHVSAAEVLGALEVAEGALPALVVVKVRMRLRPPARTHAHAARVGVGVVGIGAFVH